MKRERVPVKGGQRRRDPRQPSRVVEVVGRSDADFTGNVLVAIDNIITWRRSYIRIATLETWEVVPC